MDFFALLIDSMPIKTWVVWGFGAASWLQGNKECLNDAEAYHKLAVAQTFFGRKNEVIAPGERRPLFMMPHW